MKAMINNWDEIKGQSIWINATLEEQKEINNSRYFVVSSQQKH